MNPCFGNQAVWICVLGCTTYKLWSAEASTWEALTHISSQFWVPWPHVCSLKSVMVEVFTPQTLGNSAHQGFFVVLFLFFSFFLFFLRLLVCCHTIAMTIGKLHNLPGVSFLLCRMETAEVLPHSQGGCFACSRGHLHTEVCELYLLEWQSAQHCSQGKCEDGMVNTCNCTST